MLITWVMLFIILIIIEILTINLVTVWFAIGALVTSISCMFIDSVLIQVIIFLLVSILSLIATRPLIKKLRINQVTPTNLDRVIGLTAIVTEKIEPQNPGEVKVEGKRWTAISSKKIEKGKKVKILAIEGVKLKVQELKEEI